MRLRTFVIALVALAACGGLLRALPGSADMPYIRYVDEGHVYEHAAHLIKQTTWDTGWYRWPPFMAESTAAVAIAVSPLTGPSKLKAGARVTDRSPYYDQLEPTSLIWSGRIVVLVLSIATIAAIGLLAAELVDRRIGLLAAGLAAALPAFVSRAFVANPDVAATFFFVATALCVARATHSRHEWRWFAAAGFSAGLAFTSKYTPAAVLIAPCIVLAWGAGRSWARRVGLGLVTLVAAGFSAAASMPALVVEPSYIRDVLQAQSSYYAGKATRTGYLQQLVDWHEVGWLLVALALIGLVVLVTSPRSRQVTVAVLVPMAVLAAAFARYDDQPLRNLLPLLPMLCVAAATALGTGVDALARRRTWSLVASGRTLGAVGAVVVLATLTFGTVPFLRTTMGAVDSRVQARTWLQDHAGPSCTVVVPADVAFLSSELAKLPGHVIVVPHGERLTASTLHAANYVVAGRAKTSFPDWLGNTRTMTRVAHFGMQPRLDPPPLWRGNHQSLTIYQVRPCR